MNQPRYAAWVSFWPRLPLFWLLVPLFLSAAPLSAASREGRGLHIDQLLIILLLVGASAVIAMIFVKFKQAQAHIQGLQLDLASKHQEVSRLHQELEELNTTDEQTGLGNRRFLESVMERDVSRIEREYGDWLEGRSFAPVNTDMIFMLMKLDQEDVASDFNGSENSGRLVLHIKDTMRQVVRDSDVLIRWQEDCFLAVFRQANRDSGPFLAERLRCAVESRPIGLNEENVVPITCSIGFSCYPFLRKMPLLVSWQDVLEIAAHALMRSQREGSNQWQGIYSTKFMGDREDLLDEIMTETNKMAEANALRIYRSSSETVTQTID